MRKLYLLCSLLSFSIYSRAQHYDFNLLNEPYADLTNPTVVQTGDWDDFEETISLPISYRFYGEEVTSLIIHDDGIYFTTTGDDYIAVLGVDVMAREVNGVPASPVSYEVSGQAPNRILKIEWKNVTFYETADQYPDDYVNYQIWLYESDNRMEFRYGPSSVDPASLDFLEIVPYLVSINGLAGLSLSGDPASPDVIKEESSLFLNGIPANGTVYRFTPNNDPQSVNDDQLSRVSVYPNPSKEGIRIISENELKNYSLVDLSGREIQAGLLQGDMAEIRWDGLKPGSYFLKVESTSGRAVTRIVIQ